MEGETARRKPTHVRWSLAPRGGPYDQACRHRPGACGDHRRRPDHLRSGHVRRHGLRRRIGASRGRDLPALSHRSARPLRRAGGQGLGPSLGARCVLRFGGRSHFRRLSLRRGGLVPRRVPSRRDGPASLRHLGSDVAHLLSAGQGGVARSVGQGWAHGAGRAVHLAGIVFHRGGHLRRRAGARPVGVLRAPVRDGDRTVRQRLEGGRRPSAAGVDPSTSGRCRYGRDSSGVGPLARGSGGLALADVARGPDPSRRAGSTRCRAAPGRPAVGSMAGPSRRGAVESIGSYLAGTSRGSPRHPHRPPTRVTRLLTADALI